MSSRNIPDLSDLPDLSGRRVLVPGGTGAVGEGVVRAYLGAGADVVVPTRTEQRSQEFRRVLGEAATEHLHLVVHEYTTFPGAEQLADQMQERLGGIDDVVAPIGGWWAGKRLWEIDEADWQSAFVTLATAHMAVLRASLPRMGASGAHGVVTVIVGTSAATPVPGSGLVSMEQAAVLICSRCSRPSPQAGSGSSPSCWDRSGPDPFKPATRSGSVPSRSVASRSQPRLPLR